MDPDPLPAALDQLAAHHEQIARLRRAVRDLQGTLAQLADTPDRDADDRLASPVPKWWKLPADQHREPLAEKPGYSRGRLFGRY